MYFPLSEVYMLKPSDIYTGGDIYIKNSIGGLGWASEYDRGKREGPMAGRTREAGGAGGGRRAPRAERI